MKSGDGDCGPGCVIAFLVILLVWFFYVLASLSPPDHVPPEVSLTSLALTGLNVSASSQQITGNWDARFQIQSKSLELDYDDLESSVLYNNELLSRTVIPDFDQGARELTIIEAHHSALNALIGQREAFVSHATVKALAADLAHGSVGFDVRIEGKVNKRRLVVFCGVVPITVTCIGASGNFNSGPRACKVKN